MTNNKINWGYGSAWSLGRIPGTDLRVERTKLIDGSFFFLMSDDDYTYLHVDNNRYTTMEELEKGVIDWAVRNGRLEYLN